MKVVNSALLSLSGTCQKPLEASSEENILDPASFAVRSSRHFDDIDVAMVAGHHESRDTPVVRHIGLCPTLQQADEWKEKGNVLMKEEKFVEAMLNYTQAVKIDPDNPTYYSNRSLAFLKMQQYFLALEDANEVIRRMPKWTKGYFRKGEIEMATEHYEMAVKSYKKALETDPNDNKLKTCYEKAVTLWHQQRKKEGRLPWLGGVFGCIVAVLLIVADESISTKNPILEGDFVKFAVVTVITLICYGFGIFYRYFLESQRCSHFEPPMDLFGEGDSDQSAQPPQNPVQPKASDSKKDNVKQRRKGRS